MRLYYKLIRAFLLLGNNLFKFGIGASRLEPLVSFLFRGIASNINEGVLGADPEFRVAFDRDPVAHIGDPVPCEDRRRAVCETRCERIPLARLSLVYAQLVKPGRFLFL